MPKKPKKNPIDPLAIARSVVETAIGGTLVPRKKSKKKASVSEI